MVGTDKAVILADDGKTVRVSVEQPPEIHKQFVSKTEASK